MSVTFHFTGTGPGPLSMVYNQNLVVPPGSFALFEQGVPPDLTNWSANAVSLISVKPGQTGLSIPSTMFADAPPFGINVGGCGVNNAVFVRSPNNQTFTYTPAGSAYPGFSDLTLFTAGFASFLIRYKGSGLICGNNVIGGDPTFDPTGTGVVDSTLAVTYPVNSVLSGSAGGILAPSALPVTFSVASTTGGCGTSGYTFGVTNGSLPAGLSLNSTTGVLSGTPTASGPYAFTIYAEKKSASTYCWGSIDFAGVYVIGSGGIVLAGTSSGPLYINSIPQWQVHRFDLRQRQENKS